MNACVWWLLQDGTPVQVGEKVMAAGKLFTLSFYPSSPFLLATGGDKGLLALWDLREIDAVVQRFGSKAQQEEVAAEVVQGMEGMTVAGEAEEQQHDDKAPAGKKKQQQPGTKKKKGAK